MPAYDFRCQACDHVFEIVRRAKDASDVACPTCGSETKRVFTPVGVVFKGSGFHNTDYRAKPKESATGESCGESAPKPEAASCAEKSGTGGCSGCPAAS